MVPRELRYLESHEWAKRQEGSDIITVGLADYAIEQLGDIVFLELPAVGDKVVKGSEFCTIESVKAASDLYAPVSGEIAEVNEELTENLELFKAGAYEQAWIARIKADDMAEFESLLPAEDYEKQLEG
jgi:glycine cleavage system H protein